MAGANPLQGTDSPRWATLHPQPHVGKNEGGGGGGAPHVGEGYSRFLQEGGEVAGGEEEVFTTIKLRDLILPLL